MVVGALSNVVLMFYFGVEIFTLPETSARQADLMNSTKLSLLVPAVTNEPIRHWIVFAIL